MGRASGLTAKRPKGYLYQITDLAKCCSENDFCRFVGVRNLSVFRAGLATLVIACQGRWDCRTCAPGAAIRILDAGRIEARYVVNRLDPARVIPGPGNQP